MYSPARPPKPDAWAESEFDKIATALNGAIELTVMYAAPTKPRTGWLVYADGTTWNPGSGEGVYVYLSDGTWSKL
jgi:hypothetical protein